MFTTEGPTCSTNSVKSGKPRTAAAGACAKAAEVGTMAHPAIRAVAIQADAAVLVHLLFSTKPPCVGQNQIVNVSKNGADNGNFKPHQ
jgi:hypothetical protein